MPVVITIIGKDVLQKSTLLRGTVTFSGSYSTGGDTFNLTSAVAPIGEVIPEGCTSPTNVKIWGMTGYQYAYDPTAKKVKVFTAAGSPAVPLTELAATTYPTAIIGQGSPAIPSDQVCFEATLPKGV
jgi:hypothetical protein